MSSNSKSVVAILAAFGRTGRSVVQGLVRAGNFDVLAIGRSLPSDASELEAQGVRLLAVNYVDEPNRLKDALAGVDVLISTVNYQATEKQPAMFDAAKSAGVKRIIPCDFATSAPRGLMQLHDTKLDVRDYVRQLGVSYTFVEVGWWFQLMLPYPTVLSKHPFAGLLSRFYGEGNTPIALTDLRRIGDFVARILPDGRTVNQTVFAWEDAATQQDAWALAERLTGSSASELGKKQVSEEENRVEIEAAKKSGDPMALVANEYNVSNWFRGDSVEAKAKALGALSSKDLYPDFPTTTLEAYAQAFYARPELPELLM